MNKKFIKKVLAHMLTLSMGLSAFLSQTMTVQAAEAQEGVYQNGTELTEVEDLEVSSVDGSIRVKIWKDDADAYYFSATHNDEVVIECSQFGLVTSTEDLTKGLILDEDSIETAEGTEDYDLMAAGTAHVNKSYNQLSFTFEKNECEMTMLFCVFEDGIGYRYVVDGDTAKDNETTTVNYEVSEYVLPDEASVWTNWIDYTYEGKEYTKRSVTDLRNMADVFSEPVMGAVGEDTWMLFAEASVYNVEEPYAASFFETKQGEKSIRNRFGRYLDEEDDEYYDGRTGYGTFRDITEVNMNGTFETPWRVAIIADSPEKLATSTLIYDLNPDPEYDFDWVKPGGSTWSWWSTTRDYNEFKGMKEYIDFAAESGIEYCLVDYGWELWDNYEDRLKELVAYADERGVGILVWYGVNKMDGAHIFDLDSKEVIEEQFQWCQDMGIKGVKIDYFCSDSQFSNQIMYYLADIAAQYELVLNCHGCTSPNGEQRTYPNLLSNEAIRGGEYFKWDGGPSSIETLLTIPYTRNVLGSMEFTPTGTYVNTLPATAGFHLSMVIGYESAIQTYAASAYVYEGYAGMPLIADVPTVWDETIVLEGYPGESYVPARRSGEDWYVAVMTKDAKTYDVSFDFLEEGEYTAYIFESDATGRGIEMKTQKVTSETVLSLELADNDGVSMKITKGEGFPKTAFDEYDYYEAEGEGVTTTGEARVIESRFSSGSQVMGWVGNGANNRMTFNNITVDEAGLYEMRVFFVSSELRDLYIDINDADPVVMSGLYGFFGDYQAVSAQSIPIELEAGENTICFYNDTYYAPDIDRIAIRKMSLSEVDNPTPIPVSTDLLPIADTTIQSWTNASGGDNERDNNYGGINVIRAIKQKEVGDEFGWTTDLENESDQKVAYVRFDLSDMPEVKEDQPIMLTLTYAGRGSIGSTVRAALLESDWEESTVTWNNADQKIGDTYAEAEVTNDAMTSNGKVEIDVTKLVQQFLEENNGDKVINFAIQQATGNTEIHFASREAGESAAPKLAIVTGSYADRSKLELALRQAANYAEESYTKESYAALKEAIDAANALAEDADQNAVNAAADAVIEAMENLVEDAVDDWKFVDVKTDGSDWFYESVKYVFEENIMKGKSETIFAPYDMLSRGEFATILWRMEGEKTPAEKEDYQDVNGDEYFATAVAWAKEAGIITGYGDGSTFGPYDNITREQIATIMYRYACYKAGKELPADGDLSTFPDAGSVSAFAETGMKWAVANGVISGKNAEDGTKTLNPQDNTARAETAAIIYRYCTK